MASAHAVPPRDRAMVTSSARVFGERLELMLQRRPRLAPHQITGAPSMSCREGSVTGQVADPRGPSGCLRRRRTRRPARTAPLAARSRTRPGLAHAGRGQPRSRRHAGTARRAWRTADRLRPADELKLLCQVCPPCRHGRACRASAVKGRRCAAGCAWLAGRPVTASRDGRGHAARRAWASERLRSRIMRRWMTSLRWRVRMRLASRLVWPRARALW